MVREPVEGRDRSQWRVVDTVRCWGRGQGRRQALGVASSQRGGDKATCGGLQNNPCWAMGSCSRRGESRCTPRGSRLEGGVLLEGKMLHPA